MIGEDGARVFGSAAAGEGRVQFNFKMDEKRAGRVEKKRPRVFAFDGAASESEDEVFSGCEACDGGVFAIAKSIFTVTCEYLSDGCFGFGFDHIVGVDEVPAETSGDERTDGRFARTHEASEHDAARRLWPGLIL